MRNFTHQFFFLMFAFIMLAGCRKDSDPSTPDQSNSKVTIENYNLVTVNMTYTQVVNILGTETKRNGTSYSWSSDNTNSIVIDVMFSSSNIVLSKSQVGLASPTGGTTVGGCPASYNGRTVYTGPRGGCYYINSKGNKVYI